MRLINNRARLLRLTKASRQGQLQAGFFYMSTDKKSVKVGGGEQDGRRKASEPTH